MVICCNEYNQNDRGFANDELKDKCPWIVNDMFGFGKQDLDI